MIFGIYIFSIMAFDCIFYRSIHNEKTKEILMILKFFKWLFKLTLLKIEKFYKAHTLN